MIGDLIGLSSALFWVTSTICIRPILARAGLFSTNTLRFVFGSFAYLLLGLITGQLAVVLSLSARSYALLALTAFVALVIADTSYYSSIRTIGVARAFPVAASFPLMTAVAAVVFMGESGGWGLWAGGAAIVGGTILLSLPSSSKPTARAPSTTTAKQVLAVALAVVAAIAWAASGLLMKLVIAEVDPVTAATVRHFFAAVICGAIAVPWRSVAGPWPRGRWLALTVAAGLSTVLSFTAYVVAIEMIGVGRASLLSGVAPLFALPFAHYVLHERITPRTVVGVVATVAGIVLVV